MTENESREKSSRSEIWLRGGFILIFAIIYGISRIVLWSIVLFQFFSLLITRKTNSQLGGFSQSLSLFIYQILQYVLFNSDVKPFPFSDWPENDSGLQEQKTAKKKTVRKTTRKKKVATQKKE